MIDEEQLLHFERCKVKTMLKHSFYSQQECFCNLEFIKDGKRLSTQDAKDAAIICCVIEGWKFNPVTGEPL